MDFNSAKELLVSKGQAHVLKYFDELTVEEQNNLLDQIEKLNWSDFEALGQAENKSSSKPMPIDAVEIKDIEARHDEFEKAGLDAIKRGEVAALLLAGGMGTRLGFDKPKGEFCIGETKELYIFECLINNLLDVVKQAGCSIPLYIMTSDKNDEETRRFFKEHDYFGYKAEDISFFKQSMAAAVDYDKKLLMEEKGHIATSPNGNGGWFASLRDAGLLKDVHDRGIKWINIFAVDNVLQRMADPLFVGATILSGAASGSKVVRKVDPLEKMGLLCNVDGIPSVIEYYELSDELAHERNSDGTLAYQFGVILNYIFAVDKLEEIVDKSLPVHVVEKKIPYIDENGELVSPTEPNGYKFESLVVDMIRLMEGTCVFEVERSKEFAPVKNLHGVDSVDSARELLKANGVML